MSEPIEDINDLAEDRAAEQREEAFIAAPFHWKDTPLSALAIGREAAWLSHCRRIGLPSLSEAMTSGESFLGHAQRLIWFCAVEPHRWLSAWMKGGDLAPYVIERMIDEWSAKHIAPGDQVPLVKLAFDIHDRAHSNHAAMVADEEPDEGNAPGPSRSRSTSRSSHGPAPESSASATSSTISRRSADGRTSTARASHKEGSTSGRKPPRGKKRR
jgi:hypothetical protein